MESVVPPPLSPLKTPMVGGCEMPGGGGGKVVVCGGSDCFSVQGLIVIE